MEAEPPRFDDKSVFLQVQQFLDEWNYRIFHSGLACTLDRTETNRIVINILEMCGLEISPEQKEDWSSIEDDDALIANLVQAMPNSFRKQFDYFALQLQLVVSTATRVRHTLEEGIPEEVARCMDDGDTGVTTQILKHCCVDAGLRIHELDGLRSSWLENTKARVGRLSRFSEEAEHMQQQLAALNSQLSAFRGDQSAKNKNVLMSMTTGRDKNLVHSVFSSWVGWLLKRNADIAIHSKFKKQIQDAEDALIHFKEKQLRNVRSVLQRNAAQNDQALMSSCLQTWYTYICVEGYNKELQDKLEAASNKFNNAKASSKDNTKKVMSRMAAGQDQALVSLCMQSWGAYLQECRADRLLDDQVRAQEAQIQQFLKNKSGQAQGVLARVSGSTESGIIQQAMSAWVELYKQEKQEKEMEQLIHGQNEKFKSLNLKQRGNARSAASRANRLEEENMLAVFFHSWDTDTKMQRVIKHFGSKLDHKKHQLDAVQNMFRSFASQLEQGISSTPRSQRRSTRDMKSGSEGTASAPSLPGRPPAMPQAA